MAQTSKLAGPVTVIFIVLSLAGFGYFQFIYMPIVNAEIEIPEEWLNPPETLTVDIVIGSIDQNQEENFLPEDITITLGENNRVIWKNIDGVIHTVTAEIGKEFMHSASPANFIDPDGGEFEFLFLATGEYTYFCAPHPWMRGTVTVIEHEA